MKKALKDSLDSALGFWLLGLFVLIALGLINAVLTFLFDLPYVPGYFMDSTTSVVLLIIVGPLVGGLIGFGLIALFSKVPNQKTQNPDPKPKEVYKKSHALDKNKSKTITKKKSDDTENDKQLDEKTVSCRHCGQSNTIPKSSPDYGLVLACDNCKQSMISTDKERPYTTEGSTAMFYGYEERSLLNVRCPHCRELNDSVVVPTRGYQVSWYYNKKQENPNAAFVVDTCCVHCTKTYVIEWDQDPR